MPSSKSTYTLLLEAESIRQLTSLLSSLTPIPPSTDLFPSRPSTISPSTIATYLAKLQHRAKYSQALTQSLSTVTATVTALSLKLSETTNPAHAARLTAAYDMFVRSSYDTYLPSDNQNDKENTKANMIHTLLLLSNCPSRVPLMDTHPLQELRGDEEEDATIISLLDDDNEYQEYKRAMAEPDDYDSDDSEEESSSDDSLQPTTLLPLHPPSSPPTHTLPHTLPLPPHPHIRPYFHRDLLTVLAPTVPLTSAPPITPETPPHLLPPHTATSTKTTLLTLLPPSEILRASLLATLGHSSLYYTVTPDHVRLSDTMLACMTTPRGVSTTTISVTTFTTLVNRVVVIGTVVHGLRTRLRGEGVGGELRRVVREGVMAKFETEVWGRLRDVERTICEDFDSAKSSPHQEPPAPSVTVAHLIQFVEYLESLRYMFANMIATIDSCLPGTRMAMFLPTVTHPPPASAGDERAQLVRLIDGLVEVSRDRLFEDGGALVTTAAWREVARYADGWVNEWMCWGRVGGGWEPVEVESGGGGEGGESWRGGGGDCQVKLKPEYEVPAFLKPCQMIVVMTGEMIRVVERFEQMREIDVHKDAGGGTASAGHTEACVPQLIGLSLINDSIAATLSTHILVPLQRQYDRVAAACVKSVGRYVEDYLKAVRSVFFFADPALLTLFLRDVFASMEKKGRLPADEAMTKSFRRSCGGSEFDELEDWTGQDGEFVGLGRLDVREIYKTSEVTSEMTSEVTRGDANAVFIDPKPSWPMTMLLSPVTVGAYNRVFQIILSLKFVIGRIDAVRLRSRDKVARRDTVTMFKLMFVFSRVLDYVLAFSAGRGDGNLFDECRDFRDIVRAHEAALEEVEEILMLSGKDGVVGVVVPQLCELGLDICEAVSKKVGEREREEAERAFESKLELLLKLLEGRVRAGKKEAEGLVVSLTFTN